MLFFLFLSLSLSLSLLPVENFKKRKRRRYLPSDVYPTLICLWTVCQVTAFHLPSPICSHQWCNSLKFRNLVATTKLKVGVFPFLILHTLQDCQCLEFTISVVFALLKIHRGGKMKYMVGSEQSKFVSPCPHNINLGYFHN
uniref:Secreted protein n=1 Tax=Amphiprion percula TaxID=161767 RepID=A0A3P8SE40_AMPPE